MNPSSYLDNLSQENREILEKILSLIALKYKPLQHALIYCEEFTGEKPTVAFNNMRDFLSHLHTLVVKWNDTNGGKQKQLTTAEEHLRRAIIEPYELASLAEIRGLDETYGRYVNLVPKVEHKMNPPPPTIQEISNKLKFIYGLRENGRTAKGENDWTPVWEEGIQHFIHATEIAQEWNNKLKSEIARADQFLREKRNFWIQIGSAVGIFILGIIFGDKIKSFFF